MADGRILDFADGFESNSAPSAGSLLANVPSYANDAAFEAAKGSGGAGGDMYFNSTVNQYRGHNGIVWMTLTDNVTDETIAGDKTFTGSTEAVSSANDHVLINSGSSKISSEAQLAISRGGTSGATAVAGFDALSPNTTKGDVTANDGTNNVRVPVGTDGQVLEASSVDTEGVRWATPAGATNQSTETQNLGVKSSVAASALTVAMVVADGTTDPSPGDPVKLSMRSSTLTNGGYVLRSVTAALSAEVTSGATLGNRSAEDSRVYLYALDNAGTIELAVSGSKHHNEGELHSTTIMSATSDSIELLYSTVARASVPIRYLGYFISNQTVAGTWNAAMTAKTVVQPSNSFLSARGSSKFSQGGGHGSTDTRIRRYATTSHDNPNGYYSSSLTAANGLVITVLKPCKMYFSMRDSKIVGAAHFGITKNSVSLSSNITAIGATVIMALTISPGSSETQHVSYAGYVLPGDKFRPHTDAGPDRVDAQLVDFTVEVIGE